MNEGRPTKEKGLLHYIGVGFSGGLLTSLVIVGALVIVVPAVTGSTPMTILTSSMAETYPPGTLIIVRPVDPADISIGDAITYQVESGKAEVVTHRVVAISSSDGEPSFITKGDSNALADARPVLPVQVRGAVWYSVPYIGYANTLLNNQNREWITLGGALALFAYAGYMFASGIAHAARRRRPAKGAEQAS